MFIVKKKKDHKKKETKEKTHGTECITVSVLFTCQYFTHKDFLRFFHCSTGSCQLVLQIYSHKLAELITQEVGVTMVTLSYPGKDKAAVLNHGKVISQYKKKGPIEKKTYSAI